MTLDDIGLVASVASLVLALVAIWLSVKLYEMSERSSKATNDAALGIASSVERLEKLFDRMYADTFGMMRDTVSDMRRHIWPVDDVPVAAAEVDAADNEIAELRRQMTDEIGTLVDRIGATDAALGTVRGDIDAVVQRAISESRLLDAARTDDKLSRNTVLDAVITLTRLGGTVTADDVVSLFARRGVTGRPVIQRLRELGNSGILKISHRTGRSSLGPDSIIELSHATPDEATRGVLPFRSGGVARGAGQGREAA